MKHLLISFFLFVSIISGISAQKTPQRSAEAEQLLQCLKAIEGKKPLSGTMACVSWNLNEAKWVHQHTGKWPALNGFDYIHHPFSSKGGWIDYTDISEISEWNRQGGVVTIMWHWNVPANKSGAYSFYWGTEPDKTTFDVRKIFEPESSEYKRMIKDIDQIVGYLKLLKQANIPVLWRPLHEAGGMWFWWGRDPDACNELWRVMHRRFQDAGLDNLIWVWTQSAAWGKPYSDGYRWYPGDDYVDIVSIDVYNNNSAANIYTSCYKFLKEYSPTKLVALTECGNVPTISKQWNAGAKWLFFMPWYDHGRSNNPNSSDFKSTDHSSCNAAWWNEAFKNDFVLTREDMKALRQMNVQSPLETAFRSPSSETNPIMIWQWMDGLVSKEGITADLEAYKAAGIGGVQQFLVGGPMQVAVSDSTNAIGTDNWRSLMQHAISECARLGLTFGTHNCPGWSSSAYPTVTPEYSMQKLVWTRGNKAELPERPEVDSSWNYYEDIAVVFVPDDSIVTLEDIRVYQPSDFPLKQKGHKKGWFYRFGHTTNGKTNYATSPAGGVGLECDKMSREAVKRFWDAYPAQLIALAGNETGRTFQRLEIDSYEAGGQEWTRLMPEEFLKRRGYDIRPWLPALAGVTINSKEDTQRWRRDWQETVTDLFAENYYGYMSQLASEEGLQLMVQPYGTGSSKPFNPINTNKIVRQITPNATICAEFWAKPDNWGWKDVPRVVSAAHSSGRQQVYAEGFTCWPLHAWKDDPAALKQTADRGFCLGINRMMLHAAAQNPWLNAKPGMSFGMWGTWWTPGQTWWKDGATALFAYMSHCQALLQRGEYVDNFQSKNPSLSADAKSLQWIHRKDEETDIYFIANTKDTTFTSTISFNSTGRIPELWNPETGDISDAQVWRSEDEQTKVTLHFDTHQSLFLVFRKATHDKGQSLQLKQAEIVESLPVDGKWTLSFPDGGTIESDTLFSWHLSEHPAIKYFSGTARYTTTVRLKKIDRSTRYVLDLGEVKNLAVVTINGQRVANLWHAPFKADITNVIRKGDNTLEIEVTNLWVNRMIGDEQEEDDVEWSEPFSFGAAPGQPSVGRFMKSVPEWLSKGLPRPSKNRKAVISFKFYEKDAPLLPSGLLGPVVIRQEK